MGGPKIKRLAITYDRDNGTYLPGEMVTGKVLVEFSKPKYIKGVQIVSKGISIVQWPEKSSEKNERGDNEPLVLSGREEYFSTKFYILGSDSGSPLMLPAGSSIHPFKINLPMNLPNSLEHEFGFVRYTVTALFNGTHGVEHEVTTMFNVSSTYDLNEKPEAAATIEEKVIKNFGCLCICMKGKLFATISLPASGFAIGQTVPISVYCENESTVDVEKIKVSLVEGIKFHAKSPRWETKTDEIVVADEKCTRPFVNNSEDHVTLNLRVPPLPPSKLDFCGLIDTNYSLKIVISFSGCHFSIKRSFPILIGTIPLYSFSNVGATMPRASAPFHHDPAFHNQQFNGIPPHPGFMHHPAHGYMPLSAYAMPNSPYNPHIVNQHQNIVPPPYEASLSSR